MTHIKLVHGTIAPTRYTKIVRYPGDGTKYNRRYQDTEYASRYTKLAAPPASWTPPGPPSPNRVSVVRAPVWDNGNVYDPDTEIACQTATFTGGLGDVTYRWRWQWVPYGSNTWQSTAWNGYLNTPEGVTWLLPKEAQNGIIRMHCQAIDVYENEGGNSTSYTTFSFSPQQRTNPLPEFNVIQQAQLPNLLVPGDTYTIIPAIWEGGTDESTYRARWEWQPTPSSTWQLGDFQEYPNDALLAEIDFTVPLNAGGAQVRIMSQARDPYVTNKNNTSSSSNIEIGVVTVGEFTIEGLPYVGQTITANQPLVVGGTGTYNILYDFGAGASTTSTYVVQQSDVGSMISCVVTAYDTSFEGDTKSSTNQIGNIQPAMSLSPATTEINGEIADTTEYIPGTDSSVFTIVCTPHQTPNDFNISFSLRQSNGTLVVNPILSEECTFTAGAGDLNPIIVVSMTSRIAGDYSFSLFFNFL